MGQDAVRQGFVDSNLPFIELFGWVDANTAWSGYNLKIMKQRRLPVEINLALGFLAMILIGAVLLFLPVSHQEGQSMSFIDSLFLSTSGVCVTGLTPVDISKTLSVFGSTVLMVLFQVGGLGYAVIAAILLGLIHRSGSLTERHMLFDTFGADNGIKFNTLLRFILASTFIIELLGTLVLFIPFSQDYETGRALYIALFTSLAAFNNAGFDLFSTSLLGYNDNLLVLVTVALLIIVGGIGYVLMMELFIKVRKRGRLSLQSKIVLSTTAALLVGGTLLFYFLSPLDLKNSFFQAVTTRTAGFFSCDQASLNAPSLVLTIMLMFIGASPGSTGGGLKTTTFFVTMKSAFSLLRNKDATAFKRKIADETIKKAFNLFAVAFLLLAASLFILTVTDGDLGILELVYEEVSAFATVGLTMGITSQLSLPGKIVIIMLMYFGRVGILTLMAIFSTRRPQASYIEAKVAIG